MKIPNYPENEILTMKLLLRIICYSLILMAPFLCVPVLGYSSFQVIGDAKDPQVFSFTLLSTPPSGSTTSTLRYDFGDGESSAKESPVHSYTKPGKYSPSLTIVWSDSKGNIYTTTTTMTLVVGNGAASSILVPQKTNAPTFKETPRLTGTTRYVPTPKRSFGPLPTNLTPLMRSYPAITIPQLKYSEMTLPLPSYVKVAPYTPAAVK